MKTKPKRNYKYISQTTIGSAAALIKAMKGGCIVCCPKCNGTGNSVFGKCKRCKGNGWVVQVME